MRFIILAITLCALPACTDHQIQSAGTIAAALNGLGMQNFRIYEQYRLDSGAITQDEFNKDMAAVVALNGTVDLNIMTVQEILGVVNGVGKP